MPQLTNSKVRRGGVTAARLNIETSNLSAFVWPHDNPRLHLSFELASKGGGTTQVMLEIGTADLEVILQEVANNMPESAGFLTDCASIANKRNLTLLQQARATMRKIKNRTDALVDA